MLSTHGTEELIMSKVICDVCGATYPDTENQCPICGTAKTGASGADTQAQTGSDYAYVKGGRFSKSNVQKRNGGERELPRTTVPEKEKPTRQKPAKAERERPAPVRRERKRQREDEPSNNIGLIIIVIILVLAIVAVCVFIAMELLDRQGLELPLPGTTSSQNSDQTTPSGSTGIGGPVSIPCTGLRLPVVEHTFREVGAELLIEPDVQPENTTEDVLYFTSDPRIATVDASGKVTAVADGEAIIYVACGSYKVQMNIVCNVGVTPPEPTDPSEPTDPTLPPEPPVVLELNRKDFSLSGYNSSWNLYSGDIDRTAITWTSSNEAVAIVENGKVIAKGNGVATITAEYEGQKATCIVRCNDVIIASFTLSRTEFSIKVGDSYTLVAYDADGVRIDPSELKFSTSSEGFFTVDENGKIVGVKSNYGYYNQYVYVEYNGETLKCIVRVNAAE